MGIYVVLSIIFIGAFFVQTIQTAVNEEYATFPIRLHGSDGIYDRDLTVNILGDSLEQEILYFCEKYSVLESYCGALHDIVIKETVKRREGLKPIDLIPNAHLNRHSIAVEAEKDRIYKIDESHDFSSIIEAERIAIEKILSIWAFKRITKLVVIHSFTLSSSPESIRVLQDMFDQIQFYNLTDSVDSMIVLNYGHPIPTWMLSNNDDKLIFIQVYGTGVYFEVPTLRIVQALAKHLMKQDLQLVGILNREDSGGNNLEGDKKDSRVWSSGLQILYMHTKGVSYSEVYPQIEDWRDMMMFFLVGRHASCEHLLLSGEVDCIGVNYRSEPRPVLSGNYWWSTAAHLGALPILQYADSGKYEAETWILKRRGVRLFVPHSSSVNHAEQRYPALCYAREGPSNSLISPYALYRDQRAGFLSHSQLQSLFRDDSLCGGPKVIHSARKFWQLL